MTTYDIDGPLLRIFRAQLGQPTLRLSSDMTPNDVPGWDSGAMVSIILAMEDELGCELDPEDLRQLGSVGELARVLARHLDKAC